MFWSGRGLGRRRGRELMEEGVMFLDVMGGGRELSVGRPGRGGKSLHPSSVGGDMLCEFCQRKKRM